MHITPKVVRLDQVIFVAGVSLSSPLSSQHILFIIMGGTL